MEELDEFTESEIVTVEGWLDGLLGDMNTGPIGALIALARHKLSNVKMQVDICKKKLDAIPEQEVRNRVQQMIFRVRSKYLPEYNTFINGCNALTKLLLAASKPNVTEEKLVECLKGSMFYDAVKGKKGQSNANWTYIIMRWLIPVAVGSIPVVGTAANIGYQYALRFNYDPDKPVGQRGWKTSAQFESGLKAMDTLLDALETTLRSVRKSTDEVDPAVYKSIKWAEKETIYLGRGLTTAIRKLYAGNAVRFVSNRFIH